MAVYKVTYKVSVSSLKALFGASVFLCLRSVLRGVLGENTNHPKHYKTTFTQNTYQNTYLAHWFYKLVYSSVFNINR